MATSIALNEGLHTGMVDTSLGKLHYVSAGNGAPLVLIHGGFGSWLHWRDNIAALAQHHTVFAIDLPGFGLSCDAAPESDIDGLARPVGEAIAGLRATLAPPLRDTPPGIAAFSFGTAVAVRVALLFPGSIRPAWARCRRRSRHCRPVRPRRHATRACARVLRSRSTS